MPFAALGLHRQIGLNIGIAMQNLASLTATDKSLLVLGNQVRDLAPFLLCFVSLQQQSPCTDEVGELLSRRLLPLQVLETYIGIAVIRTVLKGFEPFPEDLFSATFRQALSPKSIIALPKCIFSPCACLREATSPSATWPG